MAGILSGIFDDGSNVDPSVENGSQAGADNGGALAGDLSIDQGVALDLELSNEMGGTYQGVDGSETTWSREDSLGIDLDTGVLLSGDTDIA